jgi:hypothetical protein
MGELDLDPAGADLIDEGGQEVIDAVARAERRMDEIHPDGAEGVLLPPGILVPEAEMEDDLARLGLRMILEADADPGVALAFAVVRSRRDRVGESEESRGSAAFGLQSVDEKPVFVVEHLLQALAGDIALGVAVNRVADAHVVGRHAFGHGAGSTTGLEEMADDLLPCPDLREGAVGGTVQIDGQGLA